MTRNRKFFNAAIAIALESEMDQMHGAVAVSGNKIIGRGHNTLNPVAKSIVGSDKVSYAHAEIVACENIKNIPMYNERLYGCHVDIYVVRIKELNGELSTRNSKPCSNCIQMLRWLGIRKIYYTTGDLTNDEYTCEKIIDIESDHISIANRDRHKHTKKSK